MARPWNRVVARMVMLPMRRERERESHILYRLPLPPPDVPGNARGEAIGYNLLVYVWEDRT